MLETASETDALKAVVSDGAGIRSVREATQLSWNAKWLAVPIWGGITGATAVFSDDAPPPIDVAAHVQRHAPGVDGGVAFGFRVAWLRGEGAPPMPPVGAPRPMETSWPDVPSVFLAKGR